MDDTRISSELLELSDAPPIARGDTLTAVEPEPWLHQFAALMLTRALIGTSAFWEDVERLRVAPTAPRDDNAFAAPRRYAHSQATRHVTLALLTTAAGASDNDAAKASLHLRLVEAEPAWTPEAEPPQSLERSLDGIDAITEGVALIARATTDKCWFHTAAPPTERREAEWCPEQADETTRYCARHGRDFEHNGAARRATQLRAVERVFRFAEPAVLETFAEEIAAHRKLVADEPPRPPSFRRRAG
jgi:hypothetical protein